MSNLRRFCPGYHLQENLDDTLGGLAIPKGWDTAGLAFASQRVAGGGDDFGGIRADQQIGTFGNGNRTLGILPQSETGHAKSGGLLLYAAGVGEDERRLAHETQEIEVAHRRNEAQLRVMRNATFGQALLGPRMDGKDDRHFASDGADS